MKFHGRWRAAVIAAGLMIGVRCPASEPGAKVMDPTLAKVAEMVGGTWVGRLHTKGGDIVVEFQYRWTADGKGIEGTGVVGKGTKSPMHMRSLLGWDPAAKKVYYCDFHGSDTAYFGYVTLDKSDMVFRFHSLVGAPGEWEARATLTDHNTYRSSLASLKGEKTAPVFHLELKREA